MPVSLCLEIILIGFVLTWFTKKRRTGRILVAMGLILIVCFSYSPIPNALLKPLEYRYKPLSMIPDRDDIKYVVVLGGGHISDPRLAANSQLSDATLIRLIEGIRVYRQLPGSKLILSGGSPFGRISNAEVMADAALSLGVNKSAIVLEELSKDTEDEAILLKGIIGEGPFVLVTSAAHMPRSVALFRKLGMVPVPAPTDYGVKERDGRIFPGMFFPSAGELQKVESAFHEYMGLAWAWIRDQI